MPRRGLIAWILAITFWFKSGTTSIVTSGGLPETCATCPCSSGVAVCNCTNVPTTLHGTFSNGTGGCTCLNGLTVALAYQNDGKTWKGTYTGCGVPNVVMTLLCNVPINTWAVSDGCALGGSLVSQCSPFQIVVTGMSGVCCSGTVKLTIVP